MDSPDRFFTAEQQGRLRALMNRWRQARDAQKELSPSEQAELRFLVNMEVLAAGKRAAAALDDLQK